jgi:hypothetical protein
MQVERAGMLNPLISPEHVATASLRASGRYTKQIAKV